MTKRRWLNTLGTKQIEVIECLDSGSERVWIKFEPVDKSQPMEVCNILDNAEEVSWRFKNSHFETVDGTQKIHYYAADLAGSIPLDVGTTTIIKDPGSKIIVFPIDDGGSLSVHNYQLNGTEFEIEVNKPLWVGYVISGSGTITPV